MGWARENLGPARCRQIAEELIRGAGSKLVGIDAGRNELQAHCPFPGHDDKHPSFSYNWEKDVFNCSSQCGGGDLVEMWARIRGMGNKAGFTAFRAAYDTPGKTQGKNPRPTPQATGDRASTGKLGGPPQEPPNIIPEAEFQALPPLSEAWLSRLEKGRGWTRPVMEQMGLRLFVSDRGEERVAIPIRNNRGDLLNVRKYMPGAPERQKVYSWAKGFGTPHLWPHPNQWRGGQIWLCEGEPDVLCALSHGLNAVCTGSGAMTWKPWWSDAFAGRDVVICYDADEVGQEGALKAGGHIARVAKQVRMIHWPEFMLVDGKLPPKGGQDLTDWFMTHGRNLGQLKELLARGTVITPPPEPPDPLDPNGDFFPERFFLQSKKGSWSFKPSRLATEILTEMDLVTDPETKIAYRWNGQFWEVVDRDTICKVALNKLSREGTTSRAQDAANQVVYRSLLDGGGVNPQENLLCLQNGTLNLDTMEVGPFDKGHLITYQLAVAFDPRTPQPCNMWLDFLDMTIQTCAVIDEFQEFFGYCLWPDNRYEKSLLLLGDGADGKSTALNVLQDLVGRENCANVDLHNMEDQFHRASLFEKVLSVDTDLDSKALASGYFKKITSGDQISAAFKHKDIFEFEPRCKLAGSANRMPRILDQSDGFWRKLLPIRFKHQFMGPDRDPNMRAHLQAELSGIMGWALVGLARLRARGFFEHSGETLALIGEHRMENNPVAAFVDELCATEPAYPDDPVQLKKIDLFKSYQGFCSKRNYFPLNEARFARELYAVLPGVQSQRQTIAGEKAYFYMGVRLAT